MSHVTTRSSQHGRRPPRTGPIDMPAPWCRVSRIKFACRRTSGCRPGHQVAVIDAVGEAIFQIRPYDGDHNFFHGLTIEDTVERISQETDYIGVSCMFSIEWPFVRRVLREIRRRFPTKPLIIGGEHVTATADWIMRTEPAVDYCVLGEGEATLVKLIAALGAGGDLAQIPGVVSRARPRKPERPGPVDRYLLISVYGRWTTSSPPPGTCCRLSSTSTTGSDTASTTGGTCRCWPRAAVRISAPSARARKCGPPSGWRGIPAFFLDEMESYIKQYGAENFSFYDLTAIVKRSWIITFCNLVLERGTKFTWQLPSGNTC